MLIVIVFVLGFFLGGITVSLLREEVKKAEKALEEKEAPVPETAVPSLQSIAAAVIAPPAPAAVISRKGKKMCRAILSSPSKQTSAAFRCPKCLKTVGKRGPFLTKRALKAHVQRCEA